MYMFGFFFFLPWFPQLPAQVWAQQCCSSRSTPHLGRAGSLCCGGWPLRAGIPLLSPHNGLWSGPWIRSCSYLQWQAGGAVTQQTPVHSLLLNEPAVTLISTRWPYRSVIKSDKRDCGGGGGASWKWVIQQVVCSHLLSWHWLGKWTCKLLPGLFQSMID